MAKSLIDTLVKTTGNDMASVVDKGIIGDLCGFLDTGSYALNALVSGSLFGGIASNKITGIAGPSSTGKTFYVLQVIKNFLDKDEDNIVMFFESEAALTKQMMVDHGIDVKRVGFIPVVTVQQFRHQAISVIEKYAEENGVQSEPKMLLVLDSLGNLSTTKEVEDMESGKETLDMTRAKLIRGAFRVMTLKLGKYNIPFMFTNHTYDTQEMFSKRIMGGGMGPVYSASTVIFLYKSKEKDGKDVIGAHIRARVEKSRLTKELQEVHTRLFFDKGLDKYFGLVELGVEAGLLKKVSRKIEFPDGTSAFQSKIEREPERYFTQEFLEELEKRVPSIFCYGESGAEEVIEETKETKEEE